MTWWRVVRWVPEAPVGAPGHPTFVSVSHQGSGRFDNPRHYTAGYVAGKPEGAIGEVYAGNLLWSPAMLRIDRPHGATPALSGFTWRGLRLLDLDDPETLSRYDMRLSAVVRRNREETRELALRVFLEGLPMASNGGRITGPSGPSQPSGAHTIRTARHVRRSMPRR